MEQDEKDKLIAEISKAALVEIKEAVKENITSQIDKLKEKFAAVGELENLKAVNRELEKRLKQAESNLESHKEAINKLTKKLELEPVRTGGGNRSGLRTILDEEDDN